MHYYIEKNIYIYLPQTNKTYCTKDIQEFKEIFEDSNILKCGYKQKDDYIDLKKADINVKNLMFDAEIAGYVLNSNITKYTLEYLSNEYLKFDIDGYLESKGTEEEPDAQMNLFDVGAHDCARLRSRVQS